MQFEEAWESLVLLTKANDWVHGGYNEQDAASGKGMAVSITSAHVGTASITVQTVLDLSTSDIELTKVIRLQEDKNIQQSDRELLASVHGYGDAAHIDSDEVQYDLTNAVMLAKLKHD